jgi:hypothetical protein
MLCDSSGGGTDWDREWQRYSLEQMGNEEDTTGLQDAMANLLSAELAMREAKRNVAAAAEEKATLEAALAETQREARLQPVISAAIAVLLALVTVRWWEGGPEAVAGCLLMPLVCVVEEVRNSVQ